MFTREAGGSVSAETSRAPVLVSYTGDPAGRIETSRAPIEIRVPKSASFDLDARTRRGQIEMASGLELEGRREERVEGADHAIGISWDLTLRPTYRFQL